MKWSIRSRDPALANLQVYAFGRHPEALAFCRWAYGRLGTLQTRGLRVSPSSNGIGS